MIAPFAEREAARQELAVFYNALKQEFGGVPPFDRFYPVDVERLLVGRGWRVEVVDIPAYVGPLGSAHALSNPASKIIYLAKTEAGDRRRFTLAHELGHIVLHPGATLARSSASTGSARRQVLPPIDIELQRLEVAADRFAANLLMPAKAVRRVFSELFAAPHLVIVEAAALLQRSSMRDRWEVSKQLSRWMSTNQRSLCSTFGVSPAAAGRRLLELELLV